jgi:hypothetical protein
MTEPIIGKCVDSRRLRCKIFWVKYSNFSIVIIGKTITSVRSPYLKNDLSGKFVKIYTDNKNLVSIVNKGSMKPELQDITLHMFQMCISNNIVLEMEWIPRDDNSYADYLSKLLDFVCKNDFDYFNLLWNTNQIFIICIYFYKFTR